jgi:DNA polymerase-3 subunit epsilon
VQATHEAHRALDDAIRAMRRPPGWAREREQISRWALRLLSDHSLLVVDVESTGLDPAYAVQTSAVDRAGTVVFNEYVQPNAVIEPAAIAVHGITPERVAQAATFGELLPRLTEVLDGRTVTAYKAGFDRGVFERELVRLHGDAAMAEQWLGRMRWKDVMLPYAVWCGLWSVKRGAYRSQPLGGPHDAVGTVRSCFRNSSRWPSACPTPAGDLSQ